jgi:hypothetical protein
MDCQLIRRVRMQRFHGCEEPQLPYHDTTYPLPELGLYYLHLRRYVYPGWQTPRRRMKGGDTSFRGGKRGLSADEGMTLYLVGGE